MKKVLFILALILISSLLFAESNFSFETGKDGNLFYFGEVTKGRIVSKNPDIKKVSGTLEFYDSYGKLFKTAEISFATEKKLILPNKKGCVEIKYDFIVNDSDKSQGSFSYATIPDNQKIMGGMTSYFGANTHFNQYWDLNVGKIVKRVGVSWIRDGEACVGNERAFDVAKENGLLYMPCFTAFMRIPAFEKVKKEMAQGKSADSTWDFSNELDCVRDYIRQYGDGIDFYNVMNEQNYSGWRELGGEEYYGPWVGIFIQWAKQVSDIIREMDPTAKIVWDDANFSNIFDYEKYGIDKEIDYISIHPYAPKTEHTYRRYITATGKTEDILIDELYKRFFDFNKEYNRSWKVMEGENGFPSFIKSEKDPTGYASRTPDIQAAALVRMYIQHLACGAERIIWYDFKDDGTDPGMAEQNFGLVKYDGSPKPSVCAYANLINIIEGGKDIYRDEDYKNPAYVYRFADRYGKKSLVCWTEPMPVYPDYRGKIISKTDYSKEIDIKTNKTSVKSMDMFGNVSYIKANNGRITVKLTEYPVYILGI